MSEWYYARNGNQVGPISFEELQKVSLTGELAPTDLVWATSMKDWAPASTVSGLFQAPTPLSSPPKTDPANPYAAPPSAWEPPSSVSTSEGLTEIEPGSEPIDPEKCLRRGYELLKRNAGAVAIICVIYVALTIGISIVSQAMTGVFAEGIIAALQETHSTPSNFTLIGIMVAMPGFLLEQCVSIFLSLGLARIALNIVSGKESSPGLMFSGGGQFLKAIVASTLFGLMVLIGFLLLIAPGVYLSIRYGQYLTAIVDRNMGIMEAFSYSSRLTQNTRGKIFIFHLFSFLLAVAGTLVCGLGLIIVLPMLWLSNVVIYRWMQYGHRATLDHEGTTVPLLAKL